MRKGLRTGGGGSPPPVITPPAGFAPADVRRLLSVDGRVKYRASVFVSRLTIPLEISASSRVFFETPAIENG
jgi:hypothetical protein